MRGVNCFPIMKLEDKAEYIDKVLGFYFDEPFLKGANLFPSPEREVESWYKFAQVFEKVVTESGIPENEWKILQLFIEDAINDLESSAFLGEKPDTERELGVGYDGYKIPVDFATKYQKLIWEEIFRVYRS